jgi:hypothetical protein
VPCEPLPAEFESDLQEIDLLLQARASATSIPRDLADMVYDATVGLIWQRQQPIPLWQRRTLRYTVGGRFAAAAALGVAFVIGALFMQTPPVDAAGPQAAVTPEMVHLMLEGAGGDLTLLEELVGDTELGYLPDTMDLDYRDLLGELDRVERDM